MSDQSESRRGFRGHLDFWLEREDARDPNWRDSPPPVQAESRPKSTVRKIWDTLVRDMQADGVDVDVTGGNLRSMHFAGRSVIWPRTGDCVAPMMRIRTHVARRKIGSPTWQQISYAWLSEELRDPVLMDLMLGEIADGTPEGVSLVGFADSSWLAAAFVGREFTAISPHDPCLPKLTVPANSACYVLRR
jgi:hypothetical protein